MSSNTFPVVVGLGLLGAAALGYAKKNYTSWEGEDTSSLNFGLSSGFSDGTSWSESGVSGALSDGSVGTVTNPAVNSGAVQGYTPQQNYAAESVVDVFTTTAYDNAAGYVDTAAFSFAPTAKQATLDPAGEVTQQSGSSVPEEELLPLIGAPEPVANVSQGNSVVAAVSDTVSMTTTFMDSVTGVSDVMDILVGEEVSSQVKEERDAAVTGAVVSGYTGFVLDAAEKASGVAAVVDAASTVVDAASTVAQTTAAVVNPIGAIITGVVSSAAGSVVESVTKPSSGDTSSSSTSTSSSSKADRARHNRDMGGSSSSSSGGVTQTVSGSSSSSGGSSSSSSSRKPSGGSSSSSSSNSAASVMQSLSNIVDSRAPSSSSSSSSSSNPISSFISGIGSWFGGLFK